MVDVRLQGGEFDGFRETMDKVDEPPNLIGALHCPGCGGIHVFPYFEILAISEVPVTRYMFVHKDDLGALYRYGEEAEDGPWSPAARPDYTTSNVTTDRTFDANATSIDELADVVGTMITDLIAIGLYQ